MQLYSSHVSLGDYGIELKAFPGLLELHRRHTRGTLELETAARDALVAGLPDAALQKFVRGVCRWGGYAGIAGRVLKNNDCRSLRDRFLAGVGQLGGAGPEDALAEINRIRGLGTPSFASKHLRFLDPQRCPVLDRRIANFYGYPFTRRGYGEYARDCSAIGEALAAASIANPSDGRHTSWFAADVDAVLFESIRGLRPRA